MERELRELGDDDIDLATPALLLLRPHLHGAATLEAAVRRQRGEGYRLLAAFVAGETQAVCVAGFRIGHFLAWGRTLYVDDLSTLEAHRGAGHARAVLERLEAIARADRCDELHLDSGFGPARASAHRRYYGSGMYASALHFRKDLRGA